MSFSKGMRVTTLGSDAVTVFPGTIIGKILCHSFVEYDGQRPDVWQYHVTFDSPDPWAPFEVMDARDLKLIGEKWLPQCECGNMWSMCHPYA
jgi:hypothetical protein